MKCSFARANGGGVLIFRILGKFKDDLRKNAKICTKVLRNLK